MKLCICMAGSAGVRGALKIYEGNWDALAGAFASNYLEDVYKRLLLQDEKMRDRACSATACEEQFMLFTAMKGESMFGLLYRMARSIKRGIDVRVYDIPICSDTIELYEFVDENPYQGDSEGVMLFLTDDPEGIRERIGMDVVIIGHLRADQQKIVRRGDEERFLTSADAHAETSQEV